uniref:Protein-tyrosine-phosphatase n=1 Tax=Caenorhabditis japonica TaxID=281687 RepID=A0A8R1HIN2_CAEJA
MRTASPRSAGSPSTIGLHTYNSAADLTSGYVIILENNEFLFDLNTKNSCIRPLESFIKLLSSSNVAKEFSHFSTLPLSRFRTVDAFFDHPELNKLGEIQVYEQTRVRAIHKHGHNYMNASWIDGFREVRKFLVSPSPISDTVSQFWRAVYDRNSMLVVTLCDLLDENKKPWVPMKMGSENRLIVDDMIIEMMNVRRVRHGCHSSLLKITKLGVTSKTVLLLAYAGWGKMGYPQRPSDVLNLVTDMNHMRKVMKQQAVETKILQEHQNTPITLVCFDGLSRSCTLAALDILCRRLDASHEIGTPFVDILDTIARLRMLRGAACMKSEQFVFLSLAMLEYAIRHHYIPVDAIEKIRLDGFIVKNHFETV